MRYTDAEIADLGTAEADLLIYGALTAAGPWTDLTFAPEVNGNKNEIAFVVIESLVGSLSVFAIGASLESVTWVDFAAAGGGDGSIDSPYNTLADGLANVTGGGRVRIKGDTADSDSSEILTLNQDVTIEAVNGAVTIGNSARRDAQRASSGFVSKSR